MAACVAIQIVQYKKMKGGGNGESAKKFLSAEFQKETRPKIL
jgi:hypothetical protein